MSSENSSSTTAKQEPRYRMEPADIPVNIREAVAAKIGPDADVYPPKDGGSYKGRIIHADDSYIVQAIGRGGRTAVVHDRNDVEIKGAALLSRDANKDLEGRNVQVHYGDRDKGGSMYPFNPDKESEQRAASASERRQNTAERIMATAQEYAEKNISSPKQRTTFMDHLRNVMDTAMERAAVPAEQRQEAPDKSKSRESAPIER